jgi:hypothetical protein
VRTGFSDYRTARPVTGEFETLQPDDIAFALGSPIRMNVAMLEVVPTFQVTGELRFARRSKSRATDRDEKRSV